MDDKSRIKRTFDDYLAAFRAGDAEACASFYAEDGEYIACGMAPLRGRKAIAGLHREIIGAGFTLDTLQTDELIVDGDLAYARQRLEGSGGKANAMLVLRRAPDGAWLVHAEAEIVG